MKELKTRYYGSRLSTGRVRCKDEGTDSKCQSRIRECLLAPCMDQGAEWVLEWMNCSQVGTIGQVIGIFERALSA